MESVSKKIFLKIAIKMKLIGEKKGDEMTWHQAAAALNFIRDLIESQKSWFFMMKLFWFKKKKKWAGQSEI